MNHEHTPINVAAPNQKARGFILNSTFTETRFDAPYAVTLFPASDSFHPTPGTAIGVEKCAVFGTERLIVRYDSQPVRKSTGAAESWPGALIYAPARDVSGWLPTPTGYEPDGDTSWMAPGVGVTATFDYERKGSGSGNHRTYKRNEIEAKVHAEVARERYQRNGFTCSPILYRVGA